MLKKIKFCSRDQFMQKKFLNENYKIWILLYYDKNWKLLNMQYLMKVSAYKLILNFKSLVTFSFL